MGELTIKLKCNHNWRDEARTTLLAIDFYYGGPRWCKECGCLVDEDGDIEESSLLDQVKAAKALQ